MNNTVFGKAMGNVKKRRNIELLTTKARRNYLLSKPEISYNKNFYKRLISNRNGKIRVRDMIRTYSQMHRTDKYSQHSSIIWPVWLNG